MVTSGPHDPLRWFFPWLWCFRVCTGGWRRRACQETVVWSPTPFNPSKLSLQMVNPLKGLGQRDEPFRALPRHALARICFDFVLLFSYLLKVMFENLFDQWHAGIVHIGPIMVCANVGSMVKARAEPKLLGALRKTVSAGGLWIGYEWMSETYLSVFHSAPNRARGKRSRIIVSSVACYAFNPFFCLEQETLQHSCYMIWQIFT